MYRTLLGILSVFLGALAVIGLTFSASRGAPADFRFINGTEPKSLDPQLTTGEPESRLTDALFEGLTRFSAKSLGPVPGAAKSWEISPDGKRYTFHIRENARWTDGTPVTAHDFTRSWRRLLRPETAAEYAYMLFPIEHAEAFNTFDDRAGKLEKALPGLARMSEQAPVEAAQWQRFVAEHKLADALRASQTPLVVDLLGRRAGSVAQAELAELRRSLGALVPELRGAARTARERFGKDQGAYAPDDLTLVVELRAPTPYFIELMSHHSAYPVPRAVAESAHAAYDWFLPGKIVSNGAYKLARWVVNDHIRLERNESYWDKDAVRLATIDVLPNDNLTTNVNLYLTGAVDWLPKNFPTELAPALRQRADFYSRPGLSVYFYRFNTTKKPLDDKRVRKAISLSVDRQLIASSVRQLGEVPAYTFVPPGLKGYEPSVTELRLDVAEARRLLAEAGYPGGKGFPRIGILINTSEDHKRLAEAIADQVRRNLGIELSVYNQEWQSYLDTTRAMDYEMARAGWIGDYLDPTTFLDMFVTNGENNYTGFSSPLYDRLIWLAAHVDAFIADPEPTLAMLREPDAIRQQLALERGARTSEKLAAHERIRFLLFREAEAILVADEFPIMPMYFYVNAGLLRKHVRGFTMKSTLPDGTTVENLKDRHPLSEMWVEGREEGPP